MATRIVERLGGSPAAEISNGSSYPDLEGLAQQVTQVLLVGQVQLKQKPSDDGDRQKTRHCYRRCHFVHRSDGKPDHSVFTAGIFYGDEPIPARCAIAALRPNVLSAAIAAR